MESKRNYRGLKKYAALIETICRTEYHNLLEEKSWARLFGIDHPIPPYKKDDYSELTENEWEGCLGVAIVISAIEGVTPNMFSISKHLDIPHFDIHLQHAFERLRINGVLSKRFGANHDPSLTGGAKDGSWQIGTERERNAWCMIAGISGGYMGMRDAKKVEDENVEKELKSESIGDKILSD
jgi:hypothetical protein